MKTAIVIGATGLIGKNLTRILLDDERYSFVKIFVRRSSGVVHPKLEEHIVDFDEIEKWKGEITGDVLFSAMGTTIKKAGSQAVQYKIDFTYQYEFAKAAAANGVRKYLLVSSIGAGSKSKNFYLKIKGELEDKISELSLKNIMIFQPSLLIGERDEKRFTEELGAKIFSPITELIPFLKKYRPIKAETVAEAMIRSAALDSKTKVTVYLSEQIQKAVNSH
ncbi:MAG: NAD(P)H-binding protein [bacterium]